MNKIISILLILFVSFISINAQQYVEIGSGTTSNNQPFYGSWNNTWSKVIYYQSEIGSAKTITTLGFNMITTGSLTLNNQKIYLKQTSATSVNTSYEDPTTNGYTLVYNGSITLNQGWFTIDITDFAYNGTDNLIVLVEDRDNTSHYKNFYCTDYTGTRVSIGGCDALNCFPTSTGYEPYPKAFPNIRFYYPSSNPATPDVVSPIDNAAKVDLNTVITFTLGANTTSYDLYLSTDSNAVVTLNSSARVATDSIVSAPGNYTFNPSTIFSPSTKYYWRVVAKDGSNTTNGNLWKFTTQNVIQNFPYFQGFEGTDVFYPGWYGYYTDWTYPTSGDQLIWSKSGPTNANSDTCALAGSPSINTANINSSIMTPRIFLPNNYRMTFFWRNGNYLKSQGIDTTFLEISNNGGTTWNILDYSSPVSNQTEYQYENIDLSAYAGNNVYIRFRHFRNSVGGANIFIDDITIEAIPTGSVLGMSTDNITFHDVALNGHNTKLVELYNTGIDTLNISSISVAEPFSADIESMQIAPNDTIVMEISLNGYNAGSQSTTLTINSNAVGANTIDLAGEVLPLTQNFFYSFESVAVGEIPENWSKIRSSDPYQSLNNIEVKNSPYDAHSVPNVIRMYNNSDTISPLILVSEGVTNFNGNTLSFWAAKSYMNPQQVDLIVGLMQDPEDASTFDTVTIITLADSMVNYTVTFDTLNINPYIAFKHGEKRQIQSIWIDDIQWEGEGDYPPTCADVVFPANQSVDNEVNVNLKWTNTSTNTEGYILYFDTQNPPLNFLDVQNVNEYLVEGLAYSTTYYWKAIAYNTYGQATGCEVWEFTTMDDPTLTVPWQEGFEDIAIGSGFSYPLGWKLINGNEQFACWDGIANNQQNPNNAHTGDKAIHSAFSMLQPLNDWLVTPAIELEQDVNYVLSFWLKAPLYIYNQDTSFEKMSVYLGDAADTLALINQLWNNNFLRLPEYEEQVVFFNVPSTGIYYLGFHAYSDPLQWLIMIDDVSMDIVFKNDEIENNITLYPNPAVNNLNILLPDSFDGNNIVEIVNSNGQIISKTSFESNKNNLNVSYLKSGIYWIKITNENGEFLTKPFVKK